MNSQTSIVAEQTRLKQWASDIRDCQHIGVRHTQKRIKNLKFLLPMSVDILTVSGIALESYEVVDSNFKPELPARFLTQ